jgi:hypothetical protein
MTGRIVLIMICTSCCILSFCTQPCTQRSRVILQLRSHSADDDDSDDEQNGSGGDDDENASGKW